MLFDAITHLSQALLGTLRRSFTDINAEVGIKVTIEVKDPYTKEVLVSSVLRDLEEFMPKLSGMPNFTLIRDSFFCQGIEYEFREPGVPTQMEEITHDRNPD